MLIISASSILNYVNTGDQGSSRYSRKAFECSSVSHIHVSMLTANVYSETMNWLLLDHKEINQLFLPQVFQTLVHVITRSQWKEKGPVHSCLFNIIM